MSRKSIILSSMILIAAVITLSTIYFVHGHQKQKTWQMPAPDIPVQTRTFDGLTFSLRNAAYTEGRVSLGIEVKGGGQVENDLGYEFYNDGHRFASSVSGKMYELGNQHYYLTADTDEVSDLPDHLNLKINILSRKSALEPHRLSATFEVPLNKEN
ncbi:hypothetical protein [Saccharibacillus endophyticus]|uniref:DUF4179 domain-containing protein n=1 Tax=Saccharibacillus endophyticus TaxID=2060666 RepID=A0ABQ1ZV96_9BACL|nr:hypothetical protein [Saccharibacillus endophyticus]GGH78060.1 hypothetical protein GCM10007362_22750 [Saccharibacillus endophyticus]